MVLTPTDIPGVVIIDLDRREDDRGFFARSFDRAVFEQAGLVPLVEQANVSYNRRAGTLRGMHMQVAPALESKLVRCTRGAIVDVIVDLREGSPTKYSHVAVELTADNRRALYVPPLFAHGFQTLADDTEVTYLVGGAYTPGAERGFRHDDPAFAISWPLPVSVISDKDATWPLLDRAEVGP